MRLVNYFDTLHQNHPSILKSIATAALLLSPLWLPAENQRDYPPKDPVPLKSDFTTNKAAPHVGNSPFPPRAEGDTLFVVDQSPGLDTICTFRSGGPLVIELPVKRHVGLVGADGTLDDAAGLVAAGFVSATAKLRMPADDIDGNGHPVPEIDEIYFNGTKIGVLSGANNAWKMNDFEVPIELIKFPDRGAFGAPPIPAINTIEVHIDTGNSSTGHEGWCMSLDWIELEFNAIAPIFFVHGTAAQSDSWEPDFTNFFDTVDIPWSHEIDLIPNGTILGNGTLLSARLSSLASSFGAKKCHIVAHSKGGLDTRAYLAQRYSPEDLEVLSVYTLGTPHRGTIVSDIVVARRAAKVNPTSSNKDIDDLLDQDWWTSYSTTSAGIGPQDPALSLQTTVAMAAFNKKFPKTPAGILFYNYGADADINANGMIEGTEAVPLFDPLTPDIQASIADVMHRAIGNVPSITVTTTTTPGRLWGENTYIDFSVPTPNSVFDKNDLVTSITSAKSPGGTYLGTRLANHSSMKSGLLASTILGRILLDFPNL